MTDKEMLAWVKANVKDGSNVAEFEESFMRMAIPDSQADALEYIKRMPSLRSVLDAEKNREYERAQAKYAEEKLPSIRAELETRIKNELNPAVTPEQIKIRELEERLNASENEKKQTALRSALMEKATGFGLDPSIASDYAVYGEQAEVVMKRHADYIKAREDAIKNDTAKNMFNNPRPKTGGGIDKSFKDMSPDEVMTYAKQGDAQKAEVMAFLKQPKK